MRSRSTCRCRGSGAGAGSSRGARRSLLAVPAQRSLFRVFWVCGAVVVLRAAEHVSLSWHVHLPVVEVREVAQLDVAGQVIVEVQVFPEAQELVQSSAFFRPCPSLPSSCSRGRCQRMLLASSVSVTLGWMQAHEKQISDSTPLPAVALLRLARAVRSRERPAIGACARHLMATASL